MQAAALKMGSFRGIEVNVLRVGGVKDVEGSSTRTWMPLE